MLTKSKMLSLLGAVALVIVLAMVPLMTACTGPTETSSPTSTAEPTSEVKTLSVGALFAQSGFFSARGVPDFNEAKVAEEMINEQGGITVNGQKYEVELVLEDYKSTMDGVSAATNKLVYDKGVDFIIGPPAMFAPAASPICESNQVMHMVTWDVRMPGTVDEDTPYAFLGGSGSLLTTAACIGYLEQTYPDVEKVAVTSPDDGSPPYVMPILRDLLEAAGISMVGEPMLYPNEMQDFSPIVTKLNAIEEADGIFMQNGLVPHIGAIAKGLRETGNNKPYAGSLPARISEVTKIAGEEAMKDVFTCGYTPDDPNMPPVAKEVIDRTEAKHGEGYQLELTGPNSLWIIKGAIEAAQSLDPTAVRDELESMDKIETIFGPAKICGEETCGIGHIVASPQSIQILKDGREASAGWFDTSMP